MVWNLRTHGERLSKETEYLQNNQTSGWSGTDGKGKGKPGKGKDTNKNKAKGKHHGKKGKKELHEMEEHDDTQDTQTSQDYTEWTRGGITLTTGLAQTGGQATGAQICGLTLHGNKRHDRWHRRNLLETSTIQSNARRQYFNVRCADDWRVVSWCRETAK